MLYAADDAGELGDGAPATTTTRKQGITDDLSTALAARAGIDPVAVVAVSADIEASYVMECGELLPEPGSPEEHDWKTLDT